MANGNLHINVNPSMPGSFMSLMTASYGLD
jgi:hypothetical protein